MCTPPRILARLTVLIVRLCPNCLVGLVVEDDSVAFLDSAARMDSSESTQLWNPSDFLKVAIFFIFFYFFYNYIHYFYVQMNTQLHFFKFPSSPSPRKKTYAFQLFVQLSSISKR